jgi:hypothetical protein
MLNPIMRKGFFSRGVGVPNVVFFAITNLFGISPDEQMH